MDLATTLTDPQLDGRLRIHFGANGRLFAMAIERYCSKRGLRHQIDRSPVDIRHTFIRVQVWGTPEELRNFAAWCSRGHRRDGQRRNAGKLLASEPFMTTGRDLGLDA